MAPSPGDDDIPEPPSNGVNGPDETPVSEPPRGELSGRLLRALALPKPTKTLLLWVLGLLVLGASLFCWVAYQHGAGMAFDVLAQFKSPIDENLGVAGLVLSCFGFFIVPAAIGGIVGGLYVNSARISAESLGEQDAAIVRQMRGGAAGKDVG